MAKTYEELMDAGFEEVIEIIADEPDQTLPPQVTKKAPEKEIAPYVVVDNSDVIAQMNLTNKLMADAMAKLVQSMDNKPTEMDLDIKRGDNGLMKGVKVTLKY